MSLATCFSTWNNCQIDSSYLVETRSKWIYIICFVKLIPNYAGNKPHRPSWRNQQLLEHHRLQTIGHRNNGMWEGEKEHISNKVYTCESICVLTFIFLNIYSVRTNSHINASLGSMLCPNCIKVWSTEELTSVQMHRFCSLQGQWVQQSCFRATCWDFSLEQAFPLKLGDGNKNREMVSMGTRGSDKD